MRDEDGDTQVTFGEPGLLVVSSWFVVRSLRSLSLVVSRRFAGEFVIGGMPLILSTCSAAGCTGKSRQNNTTNHSERSERTTNY